MKVEISADENTLTVDGIEYEAKIHIDCTGCAFDNRTNDSDGGCMIRPTTIPTYCIGRSRSNKKPIIWVKKEAEKMTETPAPAPVLQHKHFDLIVAWAKNPTQSVWVWSSNAEWTHLSLAPQWTGDFYSLGDKPTEPPMLKVKVKIKLDLDNFIIEVPHSARMSEVEKLILDKAVQFVTCKHEFLN